MSRNFQQLKNQGHFPFNQKPTEDARTISELRNFVESYDEFHETYENLHSRVPDPQDLLQFVYSDYEKPGGVESWENDRYTQ